MGKPDTARSLYEMGIGKVQAMDPDLVVCLPLVRCSHGELC